MVDGEELGVGVGLPVGVGLAVGVGASDADPVGAGVALGEVPLGELDGLGDVELRDDGAGLAAGDWPP